MAGRQAGGAGSGAVGELRSRGAVISHALCVIDREAGGSEALAEIDVRLAPLFRIHELGPG